MATPDFTKMTNLAATRLGTEVIYATDDFFADKARLISPEAPIFVPDKYDDNGKWMDGWESRRKRIEGHDWAVIKLGRSGVISGFEVDTSHFTGNFPPFCSIELANSSAEIPDASEWQEVVAQSELQGDSQHYYALESDQIWTHVRLHIYPDGGVARLRVYGHVFIDWDNFDRSQTIDLAALEYGGRAIYANDTHFGVPENLIAPGKGINMGDGWETRRRLERATDPNYWTQVHDFAVLELAHVGEVERIIIDTAFFKGNFPDRVSIQAANVSGLSDADIIEQSQGWSELLPTQKLSADNEHEFMVADASPITHIRLNVFPDGGVSRLRLFGKITR
ncbi:MAG: allantoicase [Robiginitomaculum sp.]|nr:MAG: allantoicase [Robiginitomaculum sp.]